MTEDARLADAAFFPGFFASALVEEGFAVEEEFRAIGAESFFFFFARFDFNLFQFYLFYFGWGRG